MYALKVRVLSRQPRGPFMNMNPGETAFVEISDASDFTALGIRTTSEPAYRILLRTGEVNGLRVLEMDLNDGKGFQEFKPAARAEAVQESAEEADRKKLEAEVAAKAAAEAEKAAEAARKAASKEAAKAAAEAAKGDAP